jgi:hypothetical protein
MPETTNALGIADKPFDDADLLQGYLACNRVPTNPDGSLNIGATINAATHDLWRHCFAAHDAADRELTIAYLELLLSRFMRQLPSLTGQELAFAELLRGRGDRVVLDRATSTAGVALTDGAEPEAPGEESPAAPIVPVINLIGPSDEALMQENQRLEREMLRLEHEVRRLKAALIEQAGRPVDRGEQQ